MKNKLLVATGKQSNVPIDTNQQWKIWKLDVLFIISGRFSKFSCNIEKFWKILHENSIFVNKVISFLQIDSSIFILCACAWHSKSSNFSKACWMTASEVSQLEKLFTPFHMFVLYFYSFIYYYLFITSLFITSLVFRVKEFFISAYILLPSFLFT